ncbi:HAD family hydrolase [Rhodospirillum sp. A1_3_36]|uniref:HAD family hydrolase n=1 Tax=Rhodospirillum sp. A1_3_36 TaxID=3391666 RepID=UPI0039A4F932
MTGSNTERRPSPVPEPLPALDRYRGLLLDLPGTVMVDHHRFRDLDALVDHLCSGLPPKEIGQLPPLSEDRVKRWFGDALDLMGILYEDPSHWGRFPSLDEIFCRVDPELARNPTLVAALVDTVAAFERGTIPPAHAEALRTLAQTHALAAVSNIWAPKGRWLAELSRAGVLSCFGALIFSSDGGPVKPRPGPFLAAARGLGLSPGQVLVIGDDPLRDGYGARQAGMAYTIIGGLSGLDLPTLAARLPA